MEEFKVNNDILFQLIENIQLDFPSKIIAKESSIKNNIIFERIEIDVLGPVNEEYINELLNKKNK